MSIKNTQCAYLVPVISCLHGRLGVTTKRDAEEPLYILPHALLVWNLKSLGVVFAILLHHLISYLIGLC